MANEVTTQIVREAEPIEQAKLQLMQAAANLRPTALPAYQVAGFSPEQIQAIRYGVQGIGAYQPYLAGAASKVGTGAGLAQEGANILRGADTRNQFDFARQAMAQAGQAAGQMGQYAGQAGAGLGYLGAAGSELANAQQVAQQYSQANLTGPQQLMLNSILQAQGAGPQFGQASGMIGTGAQLAQQAAQQPGFGAGVSGLMQGAQQGQQAVGQAGAMTQQGIGALYAAAQRAQQAAQLGAAPTVSVQQTGTPTMQAAQTGYNPALQTFQMGPAQQVSTGSFVAPGAAQQFMSPYMQNVVDIEKREAQRQAAIAKTGRGAQFAKAGAFGGARQAIEEAEAQRNLATQMGDIQTRGLQSAYQQAQSQFNAEQQARLEAERANQAAGLTVGQQNLAAQLGVQQLGAGQIGLQTALSNLSNAQQAAVQNQAAALQAQGLNAQQALQAALANQQMQGQYGIQGAQLGLQAADALRQAGIGTLSGAQQLGALGLQGAGLTQAAGQGQIGAAGQQGQLGLSAAGQMGQAGAQIGSLEAQRAQQALAAAQYGGTMGQQMAAQQLQQAQLGQGAANLYGQLAGQRAGIAGQYAGIAGQQAGILGQQAQLQQGLGQGIGNLAGQQFGIGQAMGQGIGSLGTQLGNLGMQQAALGQTGQQMGQQDVNFLFNLGAEQQKQQQAALDAYRATAMQTAYQPMQHLAFISDIYKGAPSSQMAMTSQMAPTPSPFQQIAGLGIAGVTAASAANRAGIGIL